jgi:hypothetical protein
VVFLQGFLYSKSRYEDKSSRDKEIEGKGSENEIKYKEIEEKG